MPEYEIENNEPAIHVHSNLVEQKTETAIPDHLRYAISSLVPTGEPEIDFPKWIVQDTDDPIVQLENAIRFMKSHEHAKGFFKKMGEDNQPGYCAFGGLLAGNGEELTDGCNFGFPFSGELAKYNAAGNMIEKIVPGGGVMRINDTTWAKKEHIVAIFQLAIEDNTEKGDS